MNSPHPSTGHFPTPEAHHAFRSPRISHCFGGASLQETEFGDLETSPAFPREGTLSGEPVFSKSLERWRASKEFTPGWEWAFTHTTDKTRKELVGMSSNG